MKAAVLYESPGQLTIEDIKIDDPAPHEVLLRVGATGLCHSDLHFLDRGRAMTGPTVLGHEGAGIVEAVGSAVSYVKPGDHVIGFSMGNCGTCEWCLQGRLTLCTQVGMARAAGAPPRLSTSDGQPLVQFVGLATFAEQMLVHENSLVKINPDIPLDRAALVGCGVATGVGAVIRTAKVPAGATVAVIGCGGIGLNVIQGAVLANAGRIIAIDINDGKLERAKQFGATDLINNSAGDALEQLEAILPGAGGVDYSFEALGHAETFQLAFAVLRRGGTATVIGIPAGTVKLPVAGFLHERKFQGSLMGSVNFREDMPYLLDLYTDGKLKLDELVSSRIKLEEINEGYHAIHNGDIARSVVVFD